jgi:hypothetical protein
MLNTLLVRTFGYSNSVNNHRQDSYSPAWHSQTNCPFGARPAVTDLGQVPVVTPRRFVASGGFNRRQTFLIKASSDGNLFCPDTAYADASGRLRRSNTTVARQHDKRGEGVANPSLHCMEQREHLLTSPLWHLLYSRS